MFTLSSSKSIAVRFLLSIAILFTTTIPLAAAVEWSVQDGGWCDLVCLPIPFPPQQTDTASTTASDEDFEILFNGKDLNGWLIQGLEKTGPKILAGGVMAVGGWDYWAVVTKKEFKNFILRFDVKFDERGNSGILIHAPIKKTAKQYAPGLEAYKQCFEIQLESGVNPRPLTDIQKTGSIWDEKGAHVPPLIDPAQVLKPIGEWNDVEIIYDDPKLSVTINGKFLQKELDTGKIDGLIHKLPKGGIAIQRNDFMKTVYFKNIRIKRLPD